MIAMFSFIHSLFKWGFYRLRVAFYWMTGRRHGVKFRQLLRYIFRPTYRSLACRIIETIEETGQHRVIRLRGISHPLYFPIQLSLTSLYQVIGESVYPTNWHYYEAPETTVATDDVVADIGAAEGFFSLLVADRCRHVWVIEPLPIFVKSLTKTFESYRNVTIVPLALGAAAGTQYIEEDSIFSKIVSSATSTTAVTMTTLDDLFVKQRQRLDYLKVDIEGYELKMLEGARETIRTYQPKIAITTYHVKDHAERISALLTELVPSYRIIIKGIEGHYGNPVMLHAWVPNRRCDGLTNRDAANGIQTSDAAKTTDMAVPEK